MTLRMTKLINDKPLVETQDAFRQLNTSITMAFKMLIKELTYDKHKQHGKPRVLMII